MHVCVQEGHEHLPFNTDLSDFLTVSIDIHGNPLAFLQSFTDPLGWRKRSWLWHSKYFPGCLSQEASSANWIKSEIGNCHEIPWLKEVWGYRHQRRLCLKPKSFNGEIGPSPSRIVFFELVIPKHGSGWCMITVLTSTHLLVRICLPCRRPGFNPWVGKIPWRRKRLPTPVFWPGEFYGLYSLWGWKESDTTERLWLSLSLFASIEGTTVSNLLYSFRGNIVLLRNYSYLFFFFPYYSTLVGV